MLILDLQSFTEEIPKILNTIRIDKKYVFSFKFEGALLYHEIPFPIFEFTGSKSHENNFRFPY